VHTKIAGRTLTPPCDLIEFDGDDLRREPIEARKAALANKSKNPKHPAVKREAEEDWGKR
jgi:hypothetical protein